MKKLEQLKKRIQEKSNQRPAYSGRGRLMSIGEGCIIQD